MSVRPGWLVELIAEEITQRVNRDPRSVSGTFLGWPRDRIFWDVIEGGQADFDKTVGHLSGADRALLYAKFNQERHLDELGAAFTQLFSGNTDFGRPTLLDLGCGPFTGGLALAAALGPEIPIRYYGIDKYRSMHALGAQFASTARRLNGLHPDSNIWFGTNLADAEFGPIRGEVTIAVASYLLASPSINVQQLVADLNVTHRRIGPGPMAVLYTNSAAPRANTKYPLFRKELQGAGFSVIVEDEETFTATSKTPKSMRYALFFKAAQSMISLG
jgi:hypothetical protein